MKHNRFHESPKREAKRVPKEMLPEMCGGGQGSVAGRCWSRENPVEHKKSKVETSLLLGEPQLNEISV